MPTYSNIENNDFAIKVLGDFEEFLKILHIKKNMVYVSPETEFT